MNSKDLYSVNLDGVDGMKKLFSFVLGVLVLCGLSGCGSVSDNDFDSYNVLSFHLDEESRYINETLESFTTYNETWTITNNSDRTISGISFTVCFTDADNTIIRSDSRTLAVSLSPGQSINQSVYSNNEYMSSSVTNYEYELENGRVIGLDLVAETCEYINYL